MQCPRCLATEPRFFHEGVCRRCLSLPFERDVNHEVVCQGSLEMLFPLTPEQEKLVQTLQEMTTDVFVEAVCGAGKTELCLTTIQNAFGAGKRVGWTTPRRQIVLELQTRLAGYFPKQSVIAVCEGYTDVLMADLIVCTTHQLYRYWQTFDILIVDEVDAYPFSDTIYLQNLVTTAVRDAGRTIYLSATRNAYITEKLKSGLAHLTLALRPSYQRLPVPIRKHRFCPVLTLSKDLYRLRQEKCLVFVPTRKLAQFLSLFLKAPYITSTSANKESLVETFREQEKGTLICTTILERGVTFYDCFVLVLHSDHHVFTAASLIQIAGRVRRGLQPRKGSCTFYYQYQSEAMDTCIQEIMSMNERAQSVLKGLK